MSCYLHRCSSRTRWDCVVVVLFHRQLEEWVQSVVQQWMSEDVLCGCWAVKTNQRKPKATTQRCVSRCCEGVVYMQHIRPRCVPCCWWSSQQVCSPGDRKHSNSRVKPSERPSLLALFTLERLHRDFIHPNHKLQPSYTRITQQTTWRHSDRKRRVYSLRVSFFYFSPTNWTHTEN